MTVAEVVSGARALGVSLLEVTGGEPLAQPDTPRLLEACGDAFDEVMLETSGGYSLAEVDLRVRVIMDIKCPDSGESEGFLIENLTLSAERLHELKFVVSSRLDFDWAVSFCREYELFGRELLFSPAADRVEPAQLAEWVMAAPQGIRLQVQLHKLLWPGDEEDR
jgi:7-carboxy-7-deazaguanine synthase